MTAEALTLTLARGAVLSSQAAAMTGSVSVAPDGLGADGVLRASVQRADAPALTITF